MQNRSTRKVLENTLYLKSKQKVRISIKSNIWNVCLISCVYSLHPSFFCFHRPLTPSRRPFPIGKQHSLQWIVPFKEWTPKCTRLPVLTVFGRFVFATVLHKDHSVSKGHWNCWAEYSHVRTNAIYSWAKGSSLSDFPIPECSKNTRRIFPFLISK